LSTNAVGVAQLRCRCPSQQALDPREQLLSAERLGQVVVGSGPQRAHLFELGAERCEHHDGHVAQLTNPLEGRPAVELGHRDVEHDQAGTLVEQELQRLPAVLGLADPIAGARQQLRDERADVGVVVDHQH
jgi:hypothetical protein